MDAPDPRGESESRVRALMFPVFQLRPQMSLTRIPGAGFMETTMSTGVSESSVSFSYTLWRHPEDHADPRNEVELDAETRRSIVEEPPWGRPAWLIEQAQVLRFPMLMEAVRTTWNALPDAETASLAHQLVAHTTHILRNTFRAELGLPADPGGEAGGWQPTLSAVRNCSARVDGGDRPAVQIDTDPFVYSFGFRVDEHVVCTTVIPRDSLPLIDLELTTFE